MKRSKKALERRLKKRRKANPMKYKRAPTCPKGGPHKDRKREASRKACRRRVDANSH